MIIADVASNKTAVKNVERYLAGIKATDIKKDDLGTKTLAYKIKKTFEGHYTVFTFDAEPNTVLELKDNLKLDETLLREMVTKIK